ncbi:hypothetical protein JI721_09210 [Alicyclobacillus cycloheptanicus]|uniref:Uncharacterized protein n=1 Tax=Alicyclobacillus cycloheptanicus TaxID=1457 RepID=A0ABT9XHR2_9BACL|nr:hypothetical protein [Alicyclobacillus cycloheptanicus]MDQ0189650.1 hypothetical protein [Alicyclobacillus cycloheptanicus]WDL99953.1 hypothetical protein JI721_09210 [Alicyclobacillus cycloheptanicus]
MKVDTFLKLGSLAFGIAQDERVRELVKMTHNGAKRRGLFAAPPNVPPAPSAQRVPFANWPRRY